MQGEKRGPGRAKQGCSATSGFLKFEISIIVELAFVAVVISALLAGFSHAAIISTEGP